MARTHIRLVMSTGHEHHLKVHGAPREVFDAIAKATVPSVHGHSVPPILLEGVDGDVVIFDSKEVVSADFDRVREDPEDAEPTTIDEFADAVDHVVKIAGRMRLMPENVAVLSALQDAAAAFRKRHEGQG